jgi:hypothetical protein
MNENLTSRDILQAWALPIMASLVVAAVLIVERTQLDWTVQCSALGPNACWNAPFNELFAWLPVAITFGAFHIWGARRLLPAPAATSDLLIRALAVGLFVAVNLLPAPGFYLLLVGVGAAFVITLTVVGVFVAPAVGALASGFVAGLLLGVLAGPSLKSLPWRGWRTLLWGYGLGGALGALVLALGQIAFDPAFANTFGLDMPWLTALGTLGTVLVVGVTTSLLAWRGWLRAGLLPPVPRPAPTAFAWPMGLAAMLIVPAHVMIAEKHTLFRRDGMPLPVLANLLRGGKPAPPTTLTLAGLTYVGPRGDVARREVISRSRMETTRVNRGASGWANVGVTVHDRLEQWQLADLSRVRAENIFITADKSALQVTYECEPGLVAGQEFCSRDSEHPQQNRTFAIALDEGLFLRSSDLPDAALGIRFDSRKPPTADKRTQARLYCRLNLTGVTDAKMSVMQIVPCDADWVMLAVKLRERLERDFVVKPAS